MVKNKFIAVFVVAALVPVVLLFKCFGNLHDAAPVLPAGHIAVPAISQETDFSCGAASLLSVLRYWGVFSGSEADLYKPLDTTTEGTSAGRMSAFAGSLGLESETKKDMTIAGLRTALAEGRTVILSIQAWVKKKPRPPWSDIWDDGHYVVLVAIDEHYIYLMDPALSDAYGYLPLDEFVERWHDYADASYEREYHFGILIRGKTANNFALPAGKLERVE
ncbi:MAG: hypothetical protein A2583_03680 [Bdellovibrionales bacterium RIFOXYD1_FULL_53_11]|nr:MAG: hypothetical protein A2583_03680 [Bdellovibrionales bacterium RIFOXYD1_FULL_53_11]